MFFLGLLQMGRLKKASSVKQRTVYVYVPSDQIILEWKQAAKRVGMSLSSYVQDAVEYYLARHDPSMDRQTLEDRFEESLHQNAALVAENEELQRKLARNDTLLDRYEKQLRELEHQSFLSQDFVFSFDYSMSLTSLQDPIEIE